MVRRFFNIIIGIFCVYSFAFSAEVKIIKTSQAGYRLLVDGKDFWVKGVVYSPIPPGENYLYNFWVDLDSIEKDAQLIKSAGFNTVRFYAPGDSLEETRKVIRLLYEKYGIYTIMGSWLGFWNYPCPFYGDEKFREKVKTEVLDMIRALKDEPGILMWVLGNENNYSFSGKINPWTSPEIEQIEEPAEKITKKAQVYYSLIEEITQAVKKIDPNHPVALGNGEKIALDIAAEYAPSVDALALIFYRGKSFGNIFNSIGSVFDRSILLSEMGCDSYNAFRNVEDQDIQAEFILSQWEEIYKNSVVSGNLKAKCLGGVIFEWIDEWWKHNPSDSTHLNYHDVAAGWSNGSYYFDIKAPRNMNMNEEWFGIVSWQKTPQGVKRAPKKVYYVLKDFFKNPSEYVSK